MNDIVLRENESSSIEKLAAQSRAYSLIKNRFYLQTFLSVFILVVLSFAQIVFKGYDFSLIIATCSITVLFLDIILEKNIAQLKEQSAKFQELFDTYVLNIKWNRVLCQDKPEHHDIYKYFVTYKMKNSLSLLENWYNSEISTVSEQVGRLVCQKTNCNYDAIIRLKFKNIILSIGIITIFLILIFALFSNMTISKLILTVVFPAVPIFQWTYKNIKSNNDSIDGLIKINVFVNDNLDNYKQSGIINEESIRQIQDGVYLNRKGSPLIPDFIYYLNRNRLEAQTAYSITQIINELQ